MGFVAVAQPWHPIVLVFEPELLSPELAALEVLSNVDCLTSEDRHGLLVLTLEGRREALPVEQQQAARVVESAVAAGPLPTPAHIKELEAGIADINAQIAEAEAGIANLGDGSMTGIMSVAYQDEIRALTADLEVAEAELKDARAGSDELGAALQVLSETEATPEINTSSVDAALAKVARLSASLSNLPDHDAIASVKGQALLFMPKGEGKTVSGIPMLPRPITKSGELSWSMTLASRGNYKSVEAHWHDEATGQKEKVTAGEGSPIKRLRHTHSTKEEAEKAAKAKLDETKRGDDTLSITMPGDPSVAAEGQILAIGFRIGVSGLWSVTSARHEITGGGFKTKIKTEKPNARAS